MSTDATIPFPSSTTSPSSPVHQMSTKSGWPHIRYVYFLRESPSHVYTNLTAYQDLFNWTLTFRLDSDFPYPYGKVYRRRHPLPDTPRNYAQGKNKLTAWFVSNCHTVGGRENLVQTLRQWIAVDQYGRCGKLKCDKGRRDMCYDMLSKDYKFYLSFENSLCKDYITEKLFNILRQDVVPVVYGLANYSRVAPPKSYIDALSFPSAKALADHLLYLHHNDTAYNEYFRWKRFHIMPNDWRLRARSFCKLCEFLHTNTSTKTYDIKKWFVDDAHCKSKNSPQIKSFIHGYSRTHTRAVISLTIAAFLSSKIDPGFVDHTWALLGVGCFNGHILGRAKFCL